MLSAASAPPDPEAEKRITELVRNAKGDLSRVDYEVSREAAGNSTIRPRASRKKLRRRSGA